MKLNNIPFNTGEVLSPGFVYPIPGPDTRARPSKNLGKKCSCLSGSDYTGGVLPDISEKTCFLFLRVKKHGVALPEIIGKTLFSFGGVEAEGREERKRKAALALICSRLVRTIVFCVATRPAAWNTVWKPVL